MLTFSGKVLVRALQSPYRLDSINLLLQDQRKCMSWYTQRAFRRTIKTNC